ncbi:unnamed protein product [Durusdinium trenchii]|uniref:Uncharacterized protein n=2 Tax=Durusdinium trenchii TaxID=1381693 RepID=A0ABP0LQI0_9DINO
MACAADMSLSSYEQHKLVDKVMIKLYELQEFWQWWGQCSRASWHAAIAAAEETPPMRALKPVFFHKVLPSPGTPPRRRCPSRSCQCGIQTPGGQRQRRSLRGPCRSGSTSCGWGTISRNVSSLKYTPKPCGAWASLQKLVSRKINLKENVPSTQRKTVRVYS